MTASPFLVVGAMKSGTTSVETLLSQHPDISVAIEKETTAFDGSVAAGSAAATILNSRSQVAGEVSTGYMQYPWVSSDPAQAVELLGEDLRIIAVLREPLARAQSHWRHWEQLGRNHASLPATLTDQGSTHVAFSRYHEQLSRWTAVLPEDQILVLRIEDYSRQPRPWERSITDFLGISPLPNNTMVQSNAADSRVVTRGLSQRISRSRAYRQFVRPLVPSVGRRAGVRLFGGTKGGGLPEEDLTVADEFRFRSLIADDAERLRLQWPVATWPATRED